MDTGLAKQAASPSPGRKSAFLETGLFESEAEPMSPHPPRPSKVLRFNSKPDVLEYEREEIGDSYTDEPLDLDRDVALDRQWLDTWRRKTHGSTAVYRLCVGALFLAILLPLIQCAPWLQHTAPMLGVRGGPIRRAASPVLDVDLVRRDSISTTDVCTRWAHMAAAVNGTMYVYGGQATSKAGQTEDTWNNNFLAIDLTKSWQISDPPITGLNRPDDLPAVSLGTMWHSYQSLYLYGGEYSSSPPATPDPYALWEYDITGARWIKHSDPKTSAGRFSEDQGQPVGRAAEGAGVTVPSLGRGFYFGGHQDGYTTPGWSQSIWRIYLTSLLEYTFPAKTNDQVNDLSDNKQSGPDGAWRNITAGGLQNSAGFAERADGLLVYVPGYGAQGILIGMGGGTNTSFQQMSQLDVYDIATSTWYKQATTGPTPKIRVNACAVVASAPDGSSQNIHMFGGQNLQPAGDQIQYDDLWILTLPSFTWIEVDQSDQPVPYARAGHTCTIWNAQMILVGGYVGKEISCDSPGVYVFDLSTLKWLTSYDDRSASNPDANVRVNPLNQQVVQRQSSAQPGGLEGSYGYVVPPVIRSVVGGGPDGGATVTQPAQMPTDGPMKSGRGISYTVTATSTATGGATTDASVGGAGAREHDGTNVGAIAAGVIAGLLALVAVYLAFCLWLHRKRLRQYKRHLNMANRLSSNETPSSLAAAGFYADHGYDGGGKTADESSPFVSGGGTRHGSGQTGSAHRESGDGPAAGKAEKRPQFGQQRGTSVDDLLAGGEPSFWGTALSPKRSLRVTNSD